MIGSADGSLRYGAIGGKVANDHVANNGLKVLQKGTHQNRKGEPQQIFYDRTFRHIQRVGRFHINAFFLRSLCTL